MPQNLFKELAQLEQVEALAHGPANILTKTQTMMSMST